MNSFSISQLSQFSGIKAHTIRIWEQRYNALNPQRSEGNTRYYSDKQLSRLLNIVSLMETGHKVSALGVLSDEELYRLVRISLLESHKSVNDYYISQLLSAGMSYDHIYFSEVFSKSVEALGLRETYISVILPLMNRLGLMYTADMLPVENEHFISNIIRQKLSAIIETTKMPENDSESWLLFLPENEFHEISLLFAHFIIRNNGGKVIYLGSDVPLDSLLSAINDINPDNLLMFLVHYDRTDHIQEQITKINTYFKGKKFYVAGNHKLISGLNLSDKAEYLQSVESLEGILKYNSGTEFHSN